jgi:hypothetical protein
MLFQMLWVRGIGDDCRGPVTVSNELVGVRPAGSTPADSAIVLTARGARPAKMFP